MSFPQFAKESNSLAKKHLTEDVFNSLADKKTACNVTLEKMLSSGIVNPDSAIGLYAGDSESYSLFAPLIVAIIEDYHKIASTTSHSSDLSPVDLTPLDNNLILSTRIRVARSVRGFPFTSHIQLKERKILEQKILDGLKQLPDEYKGSYFPLYKTISENELSFAKGDRFQDAAGINTDFPKCRGIYCSKDKQFRVWLNEEDHMRIICQDNSADIGAVFNKFCKGLRLIEENIDFEKHGKYGCLNSCPTNIGTSMRAGVHIRLKNLSNKQKVLKEITQKHNLQIRGTGGEKTEVQNCVFDISNKRRLGISETEIIHLLYNGVKEIIALEKNCNHMK